MFDQLNTGLMKVGAALQARIGSREPLRDRLRREDGQAFVEYALVLTLVGVAVALLAQWTNFTNEISNSLQKVIDALTNAGTSNQ